MACFIELANMDDMVDMVDKGDSIAIGHDGAVNEVSSNNSDNWQLNL